MPDSETPATPTALKAVRKNPLRLAILVAFFGSTLWAFNLYIPVQLGMAPNAPWYLVAQTRTQVEADQIKNLGDEKMFDFDRALGDITAKRLILGAALQKEIIIATMAGVAWVLAGLVKLNI